MSIAIGTQLGSHRVTALLGKGGMGEVWRAIDTKLKRDVAIKILPDEFSRDPERVARFQREAEVLASLNHPNIAAIYDIQEDRGERFLVLELVEGETLAERIRRGPLPIEEALDIAKYICDALEAAHEKGVVHRDIKLANVKITPEGKVKVLDFGLARISEPSPSPGEGFSDSPTLGAAATNPGVIMGTAAYMSPEQAKGFRADRRSDVFSFGCVLYEMLTGRRTFDGDTVSDVLASVLKSEPDWSRLPEALHPKVRELLRRALQKDRGRRLRDIGDAKMEIEEALASPVAAAGASLPAVARNRNRERIAWAMAAVAILASAAVSILYLNRPEPPETYLHVVTPQTADAVSMAVSPDGRKLAFAGSNQGRPHLFLRSLDSENAQALPGTDGATYPFWSPDSRSIGFFAGGRLKRIDVSGGTVQVLANTAPGRGGTWNQDGVILFSPSLGSSLSRVAAVGGAVVEVTRLDLPRSTGHGFPFFLPDGRHFVFYALGNPETRGVYWGDLDSEERMRLFDSDTAAVYSPSGYLLFIRQGTLFANRLSVARDLSA